MSKTVASLYLGVLVVLLFGIYTFAGYTVAAQPKQIEVRWLLSHQPSDLYARAADVFARELEKESGGEMVLNIVTPEELGYKETVPYGDIVRLMRDGKVEIGSAFSSDLGASAPFFWGLGTPFLFSDYAAANALFESERGGKILGDLAGDVRGLAFTFSGGFMVFASRDPDITSLADIKGKKIATSGGPVAEDALVRLGAIPVPMKDIDTVADAHNVDAVETSYTRLSGMPNSDVYIFDTEHRLLFTAIIADSAFFDSLTSQQQDALRKAATAAARIEREDSIALAEKTRQEFMDKQHVIQMSSDDRDMLKRLLTPVTENFFAAHGAGVQ